MLHFPSLPGQRRRGEARRFGRIIHASFDQERRDAPHSKRWRAVRMHVQVAKRLECGASRRFALEVIWMGHSFPPFSTLDLLSPLGEYIAAENGGVLVS